MNGNFIKSFNNVLLSGSTISLMQDLQFKIQSSFAD